MRIALFSSACVAMLATLVSCGSHDATDRNDATKLVTFEDSVAYAEGASYGLLVLEMIDSYVAEHGDTLNRSEMLAGMSAMLNNDADTKSFMAGVEAALGMKRQLELVKRAELNISYDALLQGLADVLLADSVSSEQRSFYTQQKKQNNVRLRAMVDTLHVASRRQAQTDLEKLYSDNVRSGKEIADSLRKADPSYLTSTSGIVYKINKQGVAQDINDNSRVKIGLRGQLIDGTEFQQFQEYEITVNQMLPGLSEAVALLGAGGEGRFYIPAPMAFGLQKVPHVPVGSMVVYDVTMYELVK